jgi:hypothetical protein
MGRISKENAHVRTLLRRGGAQTSGYVLTLPIDTLRMWGWKKGSDLQITCDSTQKSIVIERAHK